ncbi:MAG: hypothetical protein DHS80DRAFT_16640, partial [Piptocephalis tieghemiana]
MPRPTQTLTFSSLPSGSVVGLCHQGIVSLSPNLGLLDSITHLQLCCNHLTSLPPEIAYLSSLTTLDLSRNHLRDLPPSIALLPRLTHLHLARNHLSRFPPALALLPHLEELHLEGNLIPILPGPIIGAMKSLISLDLSHNPIRWIPVEATRLTHLQRIRVEGWGGGTGEGRVPSLKELSARTFIRHHGAMPVHLPSRILRYLERAEVCADCGGPWFDWWVDRVRMVDRSDLSIPVLHRLCFSHWSSEEERVAMLFGPRP